MVENNADILLIQQYLEGKLSPKRMHELEKQALEDPFLADALEGYAHAVKPVNSQLSILQRQLEERIAAQQEEKSVFNFTWQRLSIAAAAGLMFISAGILFWMNSHKHQQAVAANTAPKKVDVELNQGIEKDNVAIARPDTIKFPVPGVSTNKAVQQALLRKPRPNAVLRSVPESILADNGNAAVVQDKASVAGPGLSEVAIMGKSPAAKEPDAVSTAANNGVEVKTIQLSKESLASKVAPASDSPSAAKSELLKTASVNTATGMPEIGWEKYNEYIRTNLRYPKAGLERTGKVTVRFSVDGKGRLDGFNVLQGLSTFCDAEAIRIVKRGPKWKPNPVGEPYWTSFDVLFEKK